MNMETNKINELFDKIGTHHSIRQISLDDYPSSNHVAQMIAERVNAIMFFLEEFKECIKDDNKMNDLINTVWSKKLSEKESLISITQEMDLAEQIKATPNIITKLGDLQNNKPQDAVNDYLKDKLVEFKKIVNKAFELFECTFELIKSVDGVVIKENDPSIIQIFNWTALLPQNNSFKPSNIINSPSWEELCKKLDSCKCGKTNNCCCWGTLLLVGAISLVLAVIGILTMCNRTTILDIDLFTNNKWLHYIFIFVCIITILSTIVLLFYKFIQFQTKQCETNAKMKEKMMNAVLDAFHEDREFGRLQTKTEIAILEKLEKTRIDEWSRNKEHERKLNIMEQERIVGVSDVLKELAKTKNAVIIKDPHECGETITIERSILSDECCTEIKEIIENATKKPDDCCELIKKIAKCLFGDPIDFDCEKLKKCVKSFLCDKGDCEGKCKELLERIDKLIAAIEKVPSGGASTVINNCK